MKTKMFTVAFVERPFMEIPSSLSVEVDLSTFYQFSNPLKVPLFSSRLLCSLKSCRVAPPSVNFLSNQILPLPKQKLTSQHSAAILFGPSRYLNEHLWHPPSCHQSHLFDRSIRMCPNFLQRRLCIAKQSVAPFPRYLNEDRLLPHWPDPGGRYGQDRPPGPRTGEQVRARQ